MDKEAMELEIANTLVDYFNDKIDLVWLYCAAAKAIIELGYRKLPEQALEDYSDGKISFERLAEELGINFYALRKAFIHFAKLPTKPPPVLSDEELDDCYFNPPTTIANEFQDYREVSRHIAQAQRDADVKYWGNEWVSI